MTTIQLLASIEERNDSKGSGSGNCSSDAIEYISGQRSKVTCYLFVKVILMRITIVMLSYQ